VSTITKLAVSGVTASGNDGNLPTNVLDGNPATRWSSLGVGQFITLDLGSVQAVSEVDIAWYKGNTRTSKFTIDVSADNSVWTNELSATSTGNTLTAEKYILKTGASGRYVRITVNGNSSNTWASITEVSVFGGSNPIPTTRVQERTTTTAGASPPDADWTIVTDTGPLPIPGKETLTVADQAISTKGSINVQLSAQDSDPTSVVTIKIAKAPAGGILSAGTGNLYTYIPNTGFTGVDVFNYQATNNKGLTSNVGAVTITVSSVPIITCPPGEHLDPATNTCVPDVVGSNVDKFGVNKIYGDGPGSNYFMTADPSSDPRGNNPEASSSYKPKYIKNTDGSFKIKGQIEIRGAITQDNGYHESQLCTDFTKDVANGFMQDSMDWKDIEMTSYYRINAVGSSSSNGESHIEHVMRGQRSSTSTTSVGPCGCALGCSDNYHANIYCNKGSNGTARQKYEKDLFHTTGYSSDISGVNNNSAYNFKLGSWFGIKTIVYNLPGGSVQLEHWTDENATNVWKKTHSMIDHDQWGPRGAIGHCNIPTSKSGSPPITFGGPLTVFRSDNLQDYDVKFQSIRSIDSTKKFMAAEHDKQTESHDVVIKEDRIHQELED
jgi:hypothetical protein